jgi:hypothetical protein
VYIGKTMQTMKSEVVILGDSHLKESFPRIGNYLSGKFEVSGFNKSGAGFENFGETIIDSFRLTKNYVLVLSCSVNDVYNNNSKKVIFSS